MKRLFLGILIGIVSVSMVQIIWKRTLACRQYSNNQVIIYDIVENMIQSNIPGGKLVEVVWAPSAITNVTYKCKTLYDVKAVYEYGGEVKEVSFVLGWTGLVWVTPSIADVKGGLL